MRVDRADEHTRPRRRVHGGPALPCPLHAGGPLHLGRYCVASRCPHAMEEGTGGVIGCEVEENPEHGR